MDLEIIVTSLLCCNAEKGICICEISRDGRRISFKVIARSRKNDASVI